MIEQSVQPPVVAPEPPAVQEPTALRRHRHKPPESRLRRFLHRFNFEIAWLLAVTLGVVLVVVDPGNLKATLWRWTNQLVDHSLAAVDGLLGLAGRLGAADMIGGLLILLAFAALLIRIRWQLMQAASLSAVACPACGGEIRRIHRRPTDRWISLYVPVRRYRCSARQCAWSGLRVVAGRQSGRSH